MANAREHRKQWRGISATGQVGEGHMRAKAAPLAGNTRAVQPAAQAALQGGQRLAPFSPKRHSLPMATAKDLGPAQCQGNRRGGQRRQGIVNGLGFGLVNLAQKGQGQVQVVRRRHSPRGQPGLHLFDAYYGIIGKGQGHKDSHGPCLPWQHISRQNEGMCRWFEQASTAR